MVRRVRTGDASARAGDIISTAPQARGAVSRLDPAPLARPATVVGNRGHVTDRGDREADALQRAERRFATRAGPANLHFQGLHAVLHGFAAGLLGSDLGGERGRLARAAEP